MQNRTADSATFTGAITDTGQGVLLNANNVAHTTAITGGLTLNTAANAAFTATNGGTLSVQGTTNTITTTTATAVNLSGTTIDGPGVSFRSIGSTTASANTAIILSNTGAGPFSVTGTGTAGTGGTISNKSVDAVQLNTTSGLVSLNRMIIEDIGSMAGAIDTRSGHDAIQGLNVNGGLSLTGTTIRRISDQAIHGGTQGGGSDTPTVWNGLTLSGVTFENSNRYHVAGSGDANNEGMVRILGIRGTVSITNSTFSLGAQHLDLEVTAGTLNLTATGNFFDRSYKEFTSGVRASIGNHCIDVRVLAGAAANVTIGDRAKVLLGNDFLNCRIGSVRVVNQPGAWAWLAWPRTMARIGAPVSSARAREARTSAAAPSEIEEEFAAVTVPSLRKAGFSVGIFSGRALAGCSSAVIVTSPFGVCSVTAAISPSKAPSACADSALVSEVSA